MTSSTRWQSAFTGTSTLIRLGLRRDRIRMGAWSILLAGLLYGIAESWDRLYPTALSRQQLAATLALSPSLTAILGPLFDPLSTGGLTTWRSIAGYTLILGLVECFVVVRHTRADEQDGVAELIDSGVVGAGARAICALIIANLYGLTFALLTTVLLTAAGLPLTGSLALALAIAGACAVFASLSVVAAQVAHSSRGANGISGAAVALFFAISAVGNSTQNSPLIWLSPFGWAEQTRAFAGQRWWLIGLCVVVAALLAALGISIAANRDLGASLIPARLGREVASPHVANPRGLAWRIDRTWLMWWLIGALLLGALEGSILNTSLDAMTSNPALLKLIESLGGSTNLAAAFIVLMIGIFALAACGYGIATILRLRQDELSGRAELELSTAITRTSWASGHLLTGYIGSALVVLAGGLGIGLVYAGSIGQVSTSVGHAAGAALITVPAVWVVLGVTVMALGITPHWSFVGWIVLAWCVIAGWFGVILGLPEWILKTSPFGHLPGWPGAPMNWVPDLILLVITALLLVSGLYGLKRRDIPAS